MKLPNWAKLGWWAILVAITTTFLWQRYPSLVAGQDAPADVVVFLVWIALLLAPIFQEVSLLGLSFKHQIEAAKQELGGQIASLRAEVRNAVDVRNTFSPNIYLQPPPDSQLPLLERQVKSAAAETIREYGAPRVAAEESPTVSEDIQFLFATRYNLERELFRISSTRGISPYGPRVISVTQMLRTLVEAGLIPRQLERAIREVYAICSAAIHAQEVSPAKVSFVRDVADELLAALRAVR